MTVDPVTYRSIAPVQALPKVDTSSLFSENVHAALSPVDQFIANTTAINLVFVPYNDPNKGWKTELGTLVVLGYVSAVESFMRAMIAGLIEIDEQSRRLAGPKSVTFAAATHTNSGRLLTEALLENISFSTKGELEKALREFLGIEKLPADIGQALDEFRKLCELRHCCVHRFGKLGSQNAMRLGYEAHEAIIEHSFSPAISDVEAIADALQIIVKTLNNFIFSAIIDRTVLASLEKRISWNWSWNYSADKKRFLKYYNFFSARDGALKSPDAKEIYDSFRAKHRVMVLGWAKKGMMIASHP
ncbi:hypothetical protein IVB02_39270 [Bradyrhizobium sp. 166]|uniref:hypothetical protein n=1 Tax=Bradyrhizobium sp. 166 TaxID=2782638 RepID=UPI001FF721BB|nr:hypothetical protein [Bradyrhizobium sp. 166]MCK1607256.1 hypothetical protein [Bradyrhizobium sp. 166]